MAPTGSVKCEMCGKEEEIIAGGLYLIYYCTGCRNILNDPSYRREKEAWGASQKLFNETLAIITSR